MVISRWEFTDDPADPITDLGGKTMTDIANLWVKYYFEIPARLHPGSHHEPDFDRRNDLDAHQKRYQDGLPAKVPRVWNLEPANLVGFLKTILPDDRSWPVMFSSYVTFSSHAEFPSLTTPAEFLSNVRTDTGAVYRREATINKEVLAPVLIQPDEPVILTIKQDNPLGIPGGPYNDEWVYYAGFFTLLKPFTQENLGDNLIKSKGYSPNFESDVNYIVYNRGTAV